MRHCSGDRPDRYPLLELDRARERDHVVGQLTPAKVRFGTGQDEQVALAQACPPDRQCGPVEIRRPAVDDVERGPAGAIVEKLIGIQLGHDGRVVIDQRAHGEG